MPQLIRYNDLTEKQRAEAHNRYPEIPVKEEWVFLVDDDGKLFPPRSYRVRGPSLE